jgi:hypothetical protein
MVWGMGLGGTNQCGHKNVASGVVRGVIVAVVRSGVVRRVRTGAIFAFESWGFNVAGAGSDASAEVGWESGAASSEGCEMGFVAPREGEAGCEAAREL